MNRQAHLQRMSKDKIRKPEVKEYVTKSKVLLSY